MGDYKGNVLHTALYEALLCNAHATLKEVMC